jgi:hypothetical protein
MLFVLRNDKNHPVNRELGWSGFVSTKVAITISPVGARMNLSGTTALQTGNGAYRYIGFPAWRTELQKCVVRR